MRLDKFNNPIVDSQDLFDILYTSNDSSINDNLIVNITNEVTKFENLTGFNFIPASSINNNLTVEEFDHNNQAMWSMPIEYQNFDVESYCYDKCTTDEELLRVHEEITAFKQHGLMQVLQWFKYFVDTCNSNNVVWGVGRGSSVSSFVLFLLDVNLINPIKYNLDWREFLRDK